MGRGGADPGTDRGQADLPVDRLCGLPLVPRHGARVVRGPGDRGGAQPRLRPDQGRPRGAPGPGPGLHGRRPGDDRQRRLADERVPDSGGPAVLRRDVLPGRRRATGCRRSARSSMASPGRAAGSARRSTGRARRSSPRSANRRGSSGAGDAGDGPGPAGPGRPRCRRRVARADLRRAPRGLGRRAEVPPADDHRVPPPPGVRGRRRAPWRWPAGRSTRWPTAASTTSSAAASTATRPTRSGSCPHFEQMLYDNAQLARVYVHAWQLTDDRALPGRRARHARLPRARAPHRRRGIRGEPGRRHRRRRGRDVRLDGRGDPGVLGRRRRRCSWPPTT